MKIIHSINNRQIEREVDDKENIGFLLTNGLGGYAAFAKENDSRYNGWFVALGDKMFKIIDEIKIQGAAKIIKIKNDFYQAERFYEGGMSERIFFPRQKNSLVYELNRESPVEISLDARESFDGRNFGRVYEISEEDGLTIIKYAKYRNWEEDKGEGEEYEIFIAINADGGKIEKIGEWVPKHYGYDEKRASRPFDKYIYKALKISAKKIIFSAAFDKKTAKAESLFVFKNADDFKFNDKKYSNKFAKNIKIDDEETAVSYAAAKNSLSGLIVKGGKRFGVLAGLPWFFQFWTSDEAICLKSATEIDQDLARKILLRDIKCIGDDGKMRDILDINNSGKRTLNMDAAGWLFARAAEMIRGGFLDKEEIKNKFAAVIENLRKNYLRGGLACSEAGETWMDTFHAGDLRDGARIEIQASILLMYKIAFEITLDEKYKVWELELRENTRKNFWNGKILADGLNDWTIRPNIFIACYIYPNLLDKAEWAICFKEALAHLWLNWGGIATIDKTSSMFYSEYTGETPESYHRGDSWYWINNLAALSMYRVDPYVFKDYIEKILQASSDELLWHGYLGQISELSSAREQRSEGAWAQAWSAAIYMEAMEEIIKPYEFTKENFEHGFGNEVLKSMVFKTEKSKKTSRGAKAERKPSHHKKVLKICEILLSLALMITVSLMFGVAVFAMTI